MKKYYNYLVKKAVTVKNLTTIESLEVSPNFSYPTEEHDFHELVYIDSGELNCTLGDERLLLSQGELLLISPRMSHSYSASENVPASFFILCFHSASAALEILNRSMTLSNEERLLFADIVKEAKRAFEFPFNRKLKPLAAPSFGAQQIVVQKIEELLITLIRIELSESPYIRPVMNSVELENNLVRDIVSILKENLYSNITLDEISSRLFYSKTYLNGIFKKSTGMTVIRYYHRLKIDEAKKMLRESRTTGEVAARLAFESTTYFIKFFKRYENMTPTEYKKKIFG